jgi:hypothetical protein
MHCSASCPIHIFSLDCGWDRYYFHRLKWFRDTSVPVTDALGSHTLWLLNSLPRSDSLTYCAGTFPSRTYYYTRVTVQYIHFSAVGTKILLVSFGKTNNDTNKNLEDNFYQRPTECLITQSPSNITVHLIEKFFRFMDTEGSLPCYKSHQLTIHINDPF